MILRPTGLDDLPFLILNVVVGKTIGLKMQKQPKGDKRVRRLRLNRCPLDRYPLEVRKNAQQKIEVSSRQYAAYQTKVSDSSHKWFIFATRRIQPFLKNSTIKLCARENGVLAQFFVLGGKPRNNAF